MFRVFYVSEMSVFREWLRYNFGVFTETGFPGDDRYPETYEIGGQVRENVACRDILDNRDDQSTSAPTTTLSDFNGFPFHQLVRLSSQKIRVFLFGP